MKNNKINKRVIPDDKKKGKVDLLASFSLPVSLFFFPELL